jgi:hypothetical protein
MPGMPVIDGGTASGLLLKILHYLLDIHLQIVVRQHQYLQAATYLPV